MFSLIQKISRLYAFVLVKLLLIVTIASVTLVSMVRDYYGHEDVLSLLLKQRNTAQQIIIDMHLMRHAYAEMNGREKVNLLMKIQNGLTQLQEYHVDLSNLDKTSYNHVYETKAILAQEWSGYSAHEYINILISKMTAYLSHIRQSISNDSYEVYDHPSYEDLESHIKGVGLTRLSLTYNKMKEMAENDFHWHKNVLIICIVLFIGLIVTEALLIYRPFSRRIQEKMEALDKEQRIITQTSSAIKEEEARISLAMQGVNMGIFDWHIPDDQLHLSQSSYTILDMDMPENHTTAYSITHSMNDLINHIDEKDKGRFRSLLSHHLEHGRKFNIDVRKATPHSQKSAPIWVNIRGQAEWNELGDAKRFVGIMRENTAEKQAEDLKNMFMTGIESSKLAMTIIDNTAGGRPFVYASPGFSELMGYAPEHIINSNIHMLNGPDTKMEDVDRIEAIFSSGEDGYVKVIHYKSDGSPFIDEMYFTPITGQDKEVIAYVTFHEDLSEAHKRDKKDAKRQRMEAAGQLAQIVAYESNKLLSEISPPPLGEDKNRLARIQTLQQSLLGFSAHDSHNADSFNTEQEIKKIYNANTTIFGENIKWTYDLTNETDIDADNFIAYINRAELQQVLFNVIQNAVYAYDQSVKDASIEMTSNYRELSVVDAQNMGLPPQTQTYLVLSIKDYGKGISEDDIEAIFTPLYSDWDHVTSTGMGLTVARALIRSWGGEILIHSKEGIGTTAQLFIPVYMSENDKEFQEMSSLLDELNEA